MNYEKENNKFYFEGEFFDNEKDFFSYIEKWKTTALDDETVDRYLNQLKADIKSNVFRRKQFNNSEFEEYIRAVFISALKILNDFEEIENEE